MVPWHCTRFIPDSLKSLKMYLKKRGDEVTRNEMFNLMRDLSLIGAFMQLLLLTIVMVTGHPGIFLKERGFMYISDNFCTKQILGTLFMISTLPTWILLACSVSLETDQIKRNMILAIISLPLPLGLGIVFFSICITPGIHYVYVNAFVASIAGVHLVVAATAGHFVFLQSYFIILAGSALCGVLFISLAFTAQEHTMQRNAAVIFEYLAVTGFIVLNSLAADRVREHITM